MHFDVLAAACMAAELQRLLVPGRVQATLLADENSLGLEIYAAGTRRQLLLAAAPGGARLHLVDYKLRRGVEGETPLLLLVRKYLRDAVLAGITQPDPYERVLHFAFSHNQHGPTTLVVELIGRQPNLLLLRRDGRILDCLHRHPGPAGGPGGPAGSGPVSSGRVLLPGRPYTPPPPQAKLPPLDDGSPDYYERLAAVLAVPGRLAKVLVAAVAGLSLAAAREVAWRTAGDVEASATSANVIALAVAMRGLWGGLQSGACQPGLLREGDRITGFASYAAHTGGEFVPTGSLSEAIAAWSAAAAAPAATAPSASLLASPAGRTAPVDPYAAQRAEAAAQLRRAHAAVERRLAALAGDEPPPGAAEEARTAAEWLLALHSQINPGEAQLIVPLDDRVLSIDLDWTLGPVEQAQRLFRRAAKCERAALLIPQRRAALELDLALLDQLALDLQFAANQPEIAAVQRELSATGLLRERPGAAPVRSTPPSGGLLRVRSAQGLEILVGRNARQNERVTFQEAHPDDLWLHARGVPGAHVVIRSAGQVPDGATIRLAAQWAAYHSGARGDAAVDVVVTRRRSVSRAPGGRLGQVLVKQEEQVVAVPGSQPA